MACEQATRRAGSLTDSMWLVLFFQIWYVADGLYNEVCLRAFFLSYSHVAQPAILTTMDITTDGFGFMLAVGDLLWVPFVYSLQARYLAFTLVELGPVYSALVFAVHSVGYYIFRTANAEKNDFRNGNNSKSKRAILSSCTHSERLRHQICSTWSLKEAQSSLRQAGGEGLVIPTTCRFFYFIPYIYSNLVLLVVTFSWP